MVLAEHTIVVVAAMTQKQQHPSTHLHACIQPMQIISGGPTFMQWPESMTCSRLEFLPCNFKSSRAAACIGGAAACLTQKPWKLKKGTDRAEESGEPCGYC